MSLPHIFICDWWRGFCGLHPMCFMLVHSCHCFCIFMFIVACTYFVSVFPMSNLHIQPCTHTEFSSHPFICTCPSVCPYPCVHPSAPYNLACMPPLLRRVMFPWDQQLWVYIMHFSILFPTALLFLLIAGIGMVEYKNPKEV